MLDTADRGRRNPLGRSVHRRVGTRCPDPRNTCGDPAGVAEPSPVELPYLEDKQKSYFNLPVEAVGAGYGHVRFGERVKTSARAAEVRGRSFEPAVVDGIMGGELSRLRNQ